MSIYEYLSIYLSIYLFDWIGFDSILFFSILFYHIVSKLFNLI